MLEFQLPCYLLAVERGLTTAPRERQGLKAGYIGLKSPRKDHLKHEDFGKRAGEWPQVAAALVAKLQDLGRRLAAGDFRPNPTPAPEGKNLGACKYCPLHLALRIHHRDRSRTNEEGRDGLGCVLAPVAQASSLCHCLIASAGSEKGGSRAAPTKHFMRLRLSL